MKKRAISFVLAALMLVAFAVPALAAEEKTSTVTVTTLVAPAYEDAKGFSEGLAAVKKNGKWGFIDETGKVVIDFKYDYAGSFNEGFSVVARYEEGTLYSSLDDGGIDGYIVYLLDTAGKETHLTVDLYYSNECLPLGLFYLDTLENQGNLFVQEGVVNVAGAVFDTNGRQVMPNDAELKALMDKCEANKLVEFSYMRYDYELDQEVKAYDYEVFPAAVCVNGLIPMCVRSYGIPVYFLMDKTGHIVKEYSDKIETTWADDDAIYLDNFSAPDSTGYIRAARAVSEDWEATGLFGLIDYATGKWAVQPAYDGYRYFINGETFGNGMWIVQKGDKYGAVSQKTMTETIPAEYDYLDIFTNGLSAACKDGKWGYIDTYGNSYSVGLPGGGTAKNLAITGPFSENGVAAVYDEDTGKGYLVMDTPVNGVLPAIEGSDGVALSTYFPGFDGTIESIHTTISPDDIIAFEQNGKYGYYKLTFDLVGQNPFTDVLPGAYYFNEVVWAANEVIVDTSVKEFEPETGCPRWQVVDFLWRAADCPEPTLTESPFEDVTPADSFYEAVLWANENKIALGRTATTFDPYGTVNRSEALTFLYRAAGEPEAEEKGEGFADVADSAYYIDAVSWAVSQSEPIAKGIGGNKFAPNSRVIKCDMILFLYRAVEENGIDTTVGAK